MCTDAAVANVGRHKGAVNIFRNDYNPFLLNTECKAHQAALVMEELSKSNKFA